MGVENNNSTPSGSVATTTTTMTTTTATTSAAATSSDQTTALLRGRLHMAQESVIRLQKENDALRRQNAQLKTEQDHIVSLETQVTFCMEDFRREKEEHEKAKARNAELQMEVDIINRQLKSYQASTLSELSTRRQSALDLHRQRYETERNSAAAYRLPHSSYMVGGTYSRDGPGLIQCDSAADDDDVEPRINGANTGGFDEIDAFVSPSSGRLSLSGRKDTIDGGPPVTTQTSFLFANSSGATLPLNGAVDHLPIWTPTGSRTARGYDIKNTSTSPQPRRKGGRGGSQDSPISSTSSSPKECSSSACSQDILQCPRCQDKFPVEFHVEFLEHIDVCTSY